MAVLGCGRDGGTRGSRSLLPPKKVGAHGVQVARAPQGSGEAGEGLSCLVWSRGVMCSLCHTDCLHGVGFSSKDGARLAGVPGAKPL